MSADLTNPACDLRQVDISCAGPSSLIEENGFRTCGAANILVGLEVDMWHRGEDVDCDSNATWDRGPRNRWSRATLVGRRPCCVSYNAASRRADDDRPAMRAPALGAHGRVDAPAGSPG
jgi:hypothetical protein